MTSRWLRPVALLIVFLPALFAAEEHPVTIRVNPAKVTRRNFDPKRPPATMPKLTPSESGVCHFEFTTDARMVTYVDQKGPNTVEVEVDSVEMILDLPIDIWVMKNAPAKLVAHEEGHRRICEDYYKEASAVAKRLGQAMIGRKATATGRTKQEAQQKAQDILITELNDNYLKAVRYRCRVCQDHYDDITTHGLKLIGETEAIAQAKDLEAMGKIPSVGLPQVNPVTVPARGE